MLSLSYPASITVLAAGALFALGARINNACAFGTLGYLTGGSRLAYIMTLVGAALGASYALYHQPLMAFHDDVAASLLYDPSPVGFAVLALFLSIVLLTIRQRGRVWWQDLRGS